MGTTMRKRKRKRKIIGKKTVTRLKGKVKKRTTVMKIRDK